ncbi:MAG: rhomboid family intramembrane serine protease, partial [Planctomycetes bacterium]|nr:rhomboid family intramembrane serine protease [Planctomycetota bacterium]
EKQPKSEVPSRYDRGEAARQSLYEPDPPRVMPVLLLVNLIAFGISLYVAIKAGIPVSDFARNGNPAVMHEVGALSPVDLLHGEWWRLLTCCFLHFGLIHLLVNMYSLYALGLLESLWSPPRFLIIYLLSGIGGSCVAMLYDPGTPTQTSVLAGASGAIWGLMTSMMAWVFMNRSHLPPEGVSSWFRQFGVLFLLNVGVSFIPGVSASAHFGGGAVGFILATLLHVQRFAVPPRRTVATVLIVLLPILLFAALSEAIEKDPRWRRLADAEKVRERIKSLTYFRHEMLPAVDQAVNAYIHLEDNAYILTDKTGKSRKDDARLPKLRDELKAAKAMAKTALDKLGSKTLSDEPSESARLAGREYMQQLVDQLNRFERLLDDDVSWTAEERNESRSKLKNSREAWLLARGQI